MPITAPVKAARQAHLKATGIRCDPNYTCGGIPGLLRGNSLGFATWLAKEKETWGSRSTRNASKQHRCTTLAFFTYDSLHHFFAPLEKHRP